MHPLKEHMCKFKIDKITYSKSWSRTTHDDSKNKPSLYPNKTLRRSLEKNLVTNLIEFRAFIGIWNKILDEQAPIKKYGRENWSPCMNKAKAIRHRTNLRNIFLKHRSIKNRLDRRINKISLWKTYYYNSLNEKRMCDNKNHKKTIDKKCNNVIK